MPKSKFDDYIDKVGSQKELINLISLRIEQLLRQEKTYLAKRDAQEMVNLPIPINDNLYPILLEYCIHRGITKNELINKILYTNKI